MELDDDAFERRQRVVQRPGVVGERPGVDDDGRRPPAGRVHEVDEVSLVIRLVVLELDAEPPRLGVGLRHVVSEAVGAVHLGLALSQKVQIGARQQDHEGRARPGHGAVHVRQGGQHVRLVDVVHGLDARRPVQDEGQVMTRLFVAAHELHELARRRANGDVGVQVVAADDPTVQRHALVVDAIETARQQGGEDEPDGDGLTVAEVPLRLGTERGRLEGVGQGVPVVEHHAPVRLALVGGHDGGLVRRAGGHQLVVRQRQQPPARTPHPPQPVAEEGVLGHLAPARRPLARRERAQGLDVAQHRGGLPERADQVLPLGHVDRRLAADGGVDLGEQGGGDVDVRHAAWLEHRRREPRHVG